MQMDDNLIGGVGASNSVSPTQSVQQNDVSGLSDDDLLFFSEMEGSPVVEHSTLAKMADVPAQLLLGGPMDAVESTGQFMVDVLEAGALGVDALAGGSYQDNIKSIENAVEQYITSAFDAVDIAGKPKSGIGSGARTLGEFMTAFGTLAFGNVGGVVSKVPALSKYAPYIKPVVQSSIAAATTLDQPEERLAPVLKEFGLETAFTDYLAGDVDDTDLERRFKSAVDDVFAVGTLAVAGKAVYETARHVKLKQAWRATQELFSNKVATRFAKLDDAAKTIQNAADEMLKPVLPAADNSAKGVVDGMRPNKVVISDDQLRQMARLQGLDTSTLDFNAYRKSIEKSGVQERAIVMVDKLDEVREVTHEAMLDYLKRDAAGDVTAVDDFFAKEGKRFFELHGQAKDAMSAVGRAEGTFSRSESMKAVNQVLGAVRSGDVKDRKALMYMMADLFEMGETKQMADAMGALVKRQVEPGKMSAVLREVYQGFLMTPSGIVADAITKPVLPLLSLTENAVGAALTKPFVSGRVQSTVGKRVTNRDIAAGMHAYFNTLAGGIKYAGKTGAAIAKASGEAVVDAAGGQVDDALEKAYRPFKKLAQEYSENVATGRSRFDTDVMNPAIQAKTFGLRTRQEFADAARNMDVGMDIDAVPVSALENLAAHAVNYSGKAVRAVQAGQVAMDDLARPVFYNMRLNQLAVRQALEEGLNGPLLQERVRQLMMDPPQDLLKKGDPMEALLKLVGDEDALIQANIHGQARSWAEVMTFTDPPGPLLKSAMNLVNAFPGAWIVLPFMKTMSKMASFTVDRTPLGLFSPKFKADLFAGGARAQEAVGRLSVGTSLFGIGWYLSSLGHVTGDGPMDYKDLQVLQDAGFRRNSIKVDDTYYPIERLGPVAAPLLIGAKFSDIAKDREDIFETREKEDIYQSIGNAIVGTADILINQYQFQNAADLLDAIGSQDKGKIERFIKRQSSIFVSPGVARDLAAGLETNEYLQEATTLLDYVKRNYGQKTSLGVRRNKFGLKMKRDERLGLFMPFQHGSPVSKLDEELNANKISLVKPSPVIEDVELSRQEYSRLLEILEERDVYGKVKQTFDMVKEVFPNVESLSVDGVKLMPNQQDMVRETYNQEVQIAREILLQESEDLRNRVQRTEFLKATNRGLSQFQKNMVRGTEYENIPTINFGVVKGQ